MTPGAVSEVARAGRRVKRAALLAFAASLAVAPLLPVCHLPGPGQDHEPAAHHGEAGEGDDQEAQSRAGLQLPARGPAGHQDLALPAGPGCSARAQLDLRVQAGKQAVERCRGRFVKQVND